MQYLGADISLKDLAYVYALVNSFKRDCDATTDANLTTGTLALMMDKGAMSLEAIGLIKDTAVAKANAQMTSRIVETYAAATETFQLIMKKTPKPDAGPFVPHPYSAASIFAAPPAPPATLPLTETAKNTYQPSTISWEEQMKKATAVVYSRGPHAVAATEAKSKSNTKTVWILAAAAAAAFFMLKG